ncbi:MAG: SRPBCC domain-containing protein [Coriobacteriia bacterium]|nr:SRPBCC domain-containing protein [Coriobacteriia bacterium]
MDIRKRYIIPGGAEEVWQALTDVRAIEAWGAGPAEMEPVAGGRFSLWGGDIHGTNTELVPGRMLAQDWYGGDWDEPSKVTFTIEEFPGGTALDLVQSGVPEPLLTDFDRGWDDYYLGPLREHVAIDEEE